ncbi:MAG: hypothetical protein BGO26_13260 [Actinobacteria bacterium 69-20]|jgi:glucokinase|nr:MAG: hypothetical protein BGO26_13260 [Actinobacteria bacterium 69-20]
MMHSASGDTGCVIGIDVGGTAMKAVVARLDGTPLFRQRRPTQRADGPVEVLTRIAAFASDLLGDARSRGMEPVGVGLAVPGQVDEARGVAVGATNIGWDQVPLKDELTAALGLPVAVRHDVRAGALAEARQGEGRAHRNFIFLPIGTGIGCAIVLGGKPFTGDHYAAGEIGHVPIRGVSDRCLCGRTGCLETVASATAIARRYSELSGQSTANSEVVASAARDGDVMAQEVWAHAISALADAILASNTLLDIDNYVIGGGLAMAGPQLLEPLKQAIAQRPHEGCRPVLVLAGLGDEAGSIGAALSIIDELQPSNGEGGST